MISCYLLSTAELADAITAGYTLNSGPYDIIDDCLAACTETPPPPGDTCELATEITIPITFTATILAGTEHWYKFPVTNGSTYYVKFTGNSGPVAADTYYGTCDALIGIDSYPLLTSTPACGDEMSTIDGFFYIQLADVFGVDGNYTVEVGNGTCPP